MSDATWKNEFDALPDDIKIRVRHCAAQFGVPLIAAYYRAKDLGLLEQDNPSPQPQEMAKHEPYAWAYSVEEYGPTVSLDKPRASPKVTDVVPLYPRPTPAARWRVFEDIAHGWWGIEEDIFDGRVILYPKKMNREPLDGVVRAHNAALAATEGSADV